MGINVVTAAMMRQIDTIASDEYGIPPRLLMMNAGRSFSEETLRRFSGKKFIALCGKGNNGGDGYAAAWYLKNSGADVSIYEAAPGDDRADDPQFFKSLAGKAGVTIVTHADFSPYDVILDFLCGTGLNRPLAGELAELVNTANASGKTIVSCDIPSGLTSDGVVFSPVLQADYTFTVGLPKVNTVTYPGKGFCGEVSVVSAAFPIELLLDERIPYALFDSADARRLLPSLSAADSHKGMNGRVLILGGFPGFEGAALMAAEGALAAGASMVSVATLPVSRGSIAGKIPEVMVKELAEVDLSLYDTVLAGPGCGTNDAARVVLAELVKQRDVLRSLVFDAEMLKLLPELGRKDDFHHQDLILTPHFGEAAALTGKRVDELKDDRMRAAQSIADRFSAVCVLKGPATIVADRGKARINTSGNALLATAGSGDILAGVIAAFRAKGLRSFDAASLGMYLHGAAADSLLRKSRRSIRSSELATVMPAVISALVNP